MEDRILRIEEVSLDGLSNDKAMDAMRSAMKQAMQKGLMKMIVSRKNKKDFVQQQNVIVSNRRLPEIPNQLNSKQQSK